jgi:hypothetical protein
VCEIFLELLHDQGLLSCISIAKYEGKDAEKEVLVHIGNEEAFPCGGHLLDQLKDLMANGTTVDDCHLNFRLLECHDLACSYSLVTCGETSTIGKNFYPWYTTTKPHSTNLASQIPFTTTDTISLLGRKYYMRQPLIRV